MNFPPSDAPFTPPEPGPELAGLNPKDLLNEGLEPAFDPDVTLPFDGSQSSASARPRMELPLPEELTALLPGGAYRVESFLAEGGMGAVYKGTQIRLKRPVAIKIMRRDMGADHDFEERFEREAQAMAKLNHPNIVSVIDFGEAGADYLFITMELIDGVDLMDVIRSGEMTQEMALSLLPQVCDALQFAHAHGIVHRDIKPSNIMMTRDGRVKIADFGLAKRVDTGNAFRTRTGTSMGTPDYAAPEQFDPSEPIDHRADIYALGVMIYQMITGTLPRGAWRPPSERVSVSSQWDKIVSRAIQSDPADRYQNASEVKTDLSSIAMGDKKEAGRPPIPAASARANLKSRAVLAIVPVVIVSAVGAFFALQKPKVVQAAARPSNAAATADPLFLAKSENPAPDISASEPTAVHLLPQSSWKPLVSKLEWETDWEGDLSELSGKPFRPSRRFKDGLLHLQGTGLYKPNPSPDGAIRAESVVRHLPHWFGLGVRQSSTQRGYFFGVSRDALFIRYTPTRDLADSQTLQQCPLPSPLKIGDQLKLEMHIQGSQITAYWNGAIVLQVQDHRLTEAGDWGIEAPDATIKSVEVTSIEGLTEATALPLPSVDGADKDLLGKTGTALDDWKPLVSPAEWEKSLPGKREFKDGALHIINYGITAHQASTDGAVRATVRMQEGITGPAVVGRGLPERSYSWQFNNDMKTLLLKVISPGMPSFILGGGRLPQPIRVGDLAVMELRIVGSRITGLVNGQILVEVQDDQISQSGRWGIFAEKAAFDSAEFQTLPPGL